MKFIQGSLAVMLISNLFIYFCLNDRSNRYLEGNEEKIFFGKYRLSCLAIIKINWVTNFTLHS